MKAASYSRTHLYVGSAEPRPLYPMQLGIWTRRRNVT